MQYALCFCTYLILLILIANGLVFLSFFLIFLRWLEFAIAFVLLLLQGEAFVNMMQNSSKQEQQDLMTPNSCKQYDQAVKPSL